MPAAAAAVVAVAEVAGGLAAPGALPRSSDAGERSERGFEGLEVLFEGGEDGLGVVGEAERGQGLLGRRDGLLVFSGDAVASGVGQGIGD